MSQLPQEWSDELGDLLSIPSVSADPAHAGDVVQAAEWIADKVRRSGGAVAQPLCRQTFLAPRAPTPLSRLAAVSELPQEWSDELADLLRIPSVSADPAHKDDVVRAAEWIADKVRRSGG